MTKYEISQYLRNLLDEDIDDAIDGILALSDQLEDEEENYYYKAERVDNDEVVSGCLLVMDGDEYRIATSCMADNSDPNLFTVCAYEVNPDTIEVIE